MKKLLKNCEPLYIYTNLALFYAYTSKGERLRHSARSGEKGQRIRLQEFKNLIGGTEHAAIEGELKAALQEWMIMERDYLPLPILHFPFSI